MRELSLFTGAGGGILGTHLLGWRPIGYVEWDDYCQRVLAARIADGLIPAAPIFGDVREFVQSGAAEQYRGFADVVTAGFPCQPFSIAGKQLGADDERNMWPATRDVIRLVRPPSVMLENVPGLLTCGYAGSVIGDLAAMGYVGCWGCISAKSQGAPHLRNRWWVVAHAEAQRCSEEREYSQRPTQWPSSGDALLPYTIGDRSQGRPDRRSAGSEKEHDERCSSMRGISSRWRSWPSEPEIRRMVDGMANGMDRLAALGNGQVPRVVAAAWELLS